MFYTSKELLLLTSNFEKSSLRSLAKTKKKKDLSRLELLEHQLADAKRTGDKSYAEELEEEIKQIKKDTL